MSIKIRYSHSSRRVVGNGELLVALVLLVQQVCSEQKKRIEKQFHYKPKKGKIAGKKNRSKSTVIEI